MSAIEQLQEKFNGRIEFFKHNHRRYYIKIAAADLREVIRFIFSQLGARLSTCSAVDTRAGFEVLYHLSIDKEGILCTIKALAPRDNPTLDSICDIIAGAEWIELEMNELMGINFNGNPRTRPFLLADDFPENLYPLRKSHDPEKDKKND